MKKLDLTAHALQPISGPLNENLRNIEKFFRVKIFTRGQEVYVKGDQERTRKVEKVIQELLSLKADGATLTREDVWAVCRIVESNPKTNITEYFNAYRIVTPLKRTIFPKSPNQKIYIDAIRTHDIVFAIGPAGTGKTYLAMALAVEALLTNRVQRLILTRPAVEAGERLGFLPGTFVEKIHPYLRPLYDALYDMIDFERIEQYHQKGIIEIAPLAYMRGRTLNNAFVILDEAQNTTSEQMKMLLTRIGFHSKAVITGDITQIDLPRDQTSGLREALDVLYHIEGISFVFFDSSDVVRHPLVKEIVDAYEEYENEKRSSRVSTVDRIHSKVERG